MNGYKLAFGGGWVGRELHTAMVPIFRRLCALFALELHYTIICAQNNFDYTRAKQGIRVPGGGGCISVLLKCTGLKWHTCTQHIHIHKHAHTETHIRKHAHTETHIHTLAFACFTHHMCTLTRQAHASKASCNSSNIVHPYVTHAF